MGRKKKSTNQAENMFRDFMHYEPEKIGEIDIPLEEGLALVGKVTRLDYKSDKMIFKTDQKTGLSKEREYTHDFNRNANLFVSADGRFLVIGPMRQKVTSRGIEE